MEVEAPFLFRATWTGALGRMHTGHLCLSIHLPICLFLLYVCSFSHSKPPRSWGAVGMLVYPTEGSWSALRRQCCLFWVAVAVWLMLPQSAPEHPHINRGLSRGLSQQHKQWWHGFFISHCQSPEWCCCSHLALPGLDAPSNPVACDSLLLKHKGCMQQGVVVIRTLVMASATSPLLQTGETTRNSASSPREGQPWTLQLPKYKWWWIGGEIVCWGNFHPITFLLVSDQEQRGKASGAVSQQLQGNWDCIGVADISLLE